LYSRYHLIDHAIKVVGVGSVGTRCGIALLAADDHDPLLLQIKEARESVLAKHLQPSVYANGGERVVRGQRLIQPGILQQGISTGASQIKVRRTNSFLMLALATD